MQGRVFRFANIAMFVLFLSWAMFQLNDPDSVVWILLYGLAAMCCALYFFGRLSPTLGWAFAGVSILWALLLYYFVLTSDEPYTFVDDNVGEMLREAIGLTIVAGWVAWLSWRTTGEKRMTGST